ncbi:hypothetical protein L218DRAFT_935100 [Marasmius fiardii PR-910]|nr:hypothetical protein L218DRAFT_935100 [Marasmius fiardii PR-910]
MDWEPKCLTAEPPVRVMFHSALDSLSTKNAPPSASQATLLQQEMNEIKCAISSLDAEIVQLRAKLMESRQLKGSLTGRLETLKAAFHPVRRVPNEILVAIFQFGVEMENLMEIVYPPQSLDIKKAPWTYTQVCRRWRNVALSTSDLWNVVECESYAYPVTIDGVRFPLRALSELRLQRARNQPLTVILKEDFSSDRVASYLLSKSAQWRNLTIHSLELHFRFMSSCIGVLKQSNGPSHPFQGPDPWHAVYRAQ